MTINSVGAADKILSGAAAAMRPTNGQPENGGMSFGETLSKAFDAVNTLQLQSQDGARSLADGTAANVHDVTIAMEQANIALQLTATVRNKVIEAYQEVMRLQV